MSGSSVIKDNSCILKEVDGDKFSGRIVFGLDSEVLRSFRLNLFRTVDISPDLDIKGEPTDCIHACITVRLVVI